MINKKYTSNKKNSGNIPQIKDERTRYVPIGCGVCIECLQQKARGWAIRLMEEVKINNEASFVTLTFSEESIKKLEQENNIWNGIQNNEIAIIALRTFLENWRKKTKKSVKHWLVTELGHHNTKRIHLHGILWTKNEQLIREKWKFGWVYIGDYVNESTVNYCIKYVTKLNPTAKWFRPKILCSPGIGKNFINTHNSKLKTFKNEKTDESYNYKNGKKGALPQYYRNKIYSEDERELLWINRLNKEERWVRGEKVSIKNGLDEYKKLRDWHREQNIKMGYGYLKTNEETYEKRCKSIKKITNIAKHTHTSPEASDITHKDNNELTANLNFENENEEKNRRSSYRKMGNQIP